MQIMTPLLSVAFIGSAFALGRYTDLKPKQMLLIGIIALIAQQAMTYVMDRKGGPESNVAYSSSSDKIPSTKKVAILVHGCHLKAKQWGHIVFGTPEHLGRVPLAIKIAIEENASKIIWGSGASHTEGGIPESESEYTFNQALGSKLEELAELVKMEPQLLSQHIQNISVIDQAARNTLEELLFAVEECQECGISKLILVSSPTHIARCHQLACQIKSEQPNLPIEFWATASEICYAGSGPGDVAILEPPHRGDKPEVYFNCTAKLIFPLLESPEIAHEYNKEWERLTKTYLEKIQKLANPST